MECLVSIWVLHSGDSCRKHGIRECSKEGNAQELHISSHPSNTLMFGKCRKASLQCSKRSAYRMRTAPLPRLREYRFHLPVPSSNEGWDLPHTRSVIDACAAWPCRGPAAVFCTSNGASRTGCRQHCSVATHHTWWCDIGECKLLVPFVSYFRMPMDLDTTGSYFQHCKELNIMPLKPGTLLPLCVTLELYTAVNGDHEGIERLPLHAMFD